MTQARLLLAFASVFLLLAACGGSTGAPTAPLEPFVATFPDDTPGGGGAPPRGGPARIGPLAALRG